ncbi:MAG: hypothetical protein AB7I59_03320 [Geminicoccaceae bacterium]
MDGEVLAAAVDLLLTDPVLGRDALYRPGDTGAGVPVRVVLARPDRVGSFGETRIASGTSMLEVRRSEVPSPAAGDSFEVDGERLLVQGEPLADAEQLVWTVEARPA